MKAFSPQGGKVWEKGKEKKISESVPTSHETQARLRGNKHFSS